MGPDRRGRKPGPRIRKANAKPPMLEQIGKILVFAGVAIAGLGAIFWALGAIGLRKLPGDLLFRSDGVTVFIPIVTCLILSALMTLGLWLWHWLMR
jgi:hypothetical protein